MKWITRSHVHVDRVACPWLIRRFVDLNAEFVFVPKSQIDDMAGQKGAIPFDAPGVELGHQNGLCTFDVIIKKYELTDNALLRMAKIVNAADTDRLEDDPVADGLEAIAVGYGVRFPNDHENINISSKSMTPSTPGAGFGLRVKQIDRDADFHRYMLPVF